MVLVGAENIPVFEEVGGKRGWEWGRVCDNMSVFYRCFKHGGTKACGRVTDRPSEIKEDGRSRGKISKYSLGTFFRFGCTH